MHTRSRVHVNRPTLTQCEEFPKNSLSLLRAPQFLSHSSSPELVVLYLSFRAVLFLVLDLVFLITAPFSLGCFSLCFFSIWYGVLRRTQPSTSELPPFLISLSLFLSIHPLRVWEGPHHWWCHLWNADDAGVRRGVWRSETEQQIQKERYE